MEFKKINQNIYHWMIINLPFKLMYKKHYIDNNSSIYIPRFGWSKKQIEEANKKVDDLLKNLNID